MSPNNQSSQGTGMVDQTTVISSPSATRCAAEVCGTPVGMMSMVRAMLLVSLVCLAWLIRRGSATSLATLMRLVPHEGFACQSEWLFIIVGFQCHGIHSVLPKSLTISISGSQPNAICLHQLGYLLLSFDILQLLAFACPPTTGFPYGIATMPSQNHFKVGTLSVRDLSTQRVDFGPLSFRCWHDALVLLVSTTRMGRI